jgi:hypothetical protein
MADKDLLTMTDAEELAADDAAEPGHPERSEGSPDEEILRSAQDDINAKNKVPEIPVSERAILMSQADLDMVLAAHSRWVDAVLDPRAGIVGGRANLSQLDLTPYNLYRANLGGANLSGAIMHGMDLSGCNLTAADLRGADLRAADLRGARLSRARIDGARIAGADLSGATLTGVDLTKAIAKEAEEADGSPTPATPAGDDETSVMPSAEGASGIRMDGAVETHAE